MAGSTRAFCAALLTTVWLVSGWPAPLASARAGSAAPGPGWTAPLPPPLDVLRPFAPPASRYGAGHRGVDLGAPAGTAVRAAQAGVVGYAGLLAGRGVVSVRHDGGLRTTYEPVEPLVHAGDRVAAGAVLGRLVAGHAGCPAPACLHWGLLRGTDYLDPLRMLGHGPIRLLPLWTTEPIGPLPAAPRLEPRADSASAAPTTGRTGSPAGRAVQVTAAGTTAAGLVGGTAIAVSRRRRRRRSAARPASHAVRAAGGRPAVSRAGRRASRAVAAPPWCASGRSGSR